MEQGGKRDYGYVLGKSKKKAKGYKKAAEKVRDKFTDSVLKKLLGFDLDGVVEDAETSVEDAEN